MLRDLGKDVQLFDGVSTWFSRVNAYAESRGLTPEHYIISSGLKEIIEGTPIASEFKEIYAASFCYDEHGVACWPAMAVNYTSKTQFLFRINKGMLDYDQDVNDHMPEDMRPIPFANMIYIGDGPTDVPCFTVMRRNGGHAVAVYNPEDETGRSFRKCYNLASNSDRVNFIAPADYTPGSHLTRLLSGMVTDIANGIVRRRDRALADSCIAAPSFSK